MLGLMTLKIVIVLTLSTCFKHLDNSTLMKIIVLGDLFCPLRGARPNSKSKQGDVAVLAAGRGSEAGQKT